LGAAYFEGRGVKPMGDELLELAKELVGREREREER